MNLPDKVVMFPQPEPQIFELCAYCGQEIHKQEEYFEVDGYEFCDDTCYTKLLVEEGGAFWRIAGE